MLPIVIFLLLALIALAMPTAQPPKPTPIAAPRPVIQEIQQQEDPVLARVRRMGIAPGQGRRADLGL